jgi:hypothetical protein
MQDEWEAARNARRLLVGKLLAKAVEIMTIRWGWLCYETLGNYDPPNRGQLPAADVTVR